MADALENESKPKRVVVKKKERAGKADRGEEGIGKGRKGGKGGLSPLQESAVRELARGRGMAQAAKAVGIGRSTLYRWMGEPVFIASMNRWRARTTAMAQGQLTAVLREAETVAKAIRGGDVRAALTLLKQMGAMVPGESASEDPAVVAREQELAGRGTM